MADVMCQVASDRVTPPWMIARKGSDREGEGLAHIDQEQDDNVGQ